ncbi:MAG: hypothetical protein AAF108_00775 [Planctomycetota bacterium]
MLVLDATKVSFAGSGLGGARLIAVDRVAATELVSFSDDGPHVVFADVPQQRVTLKLVRRLPTGTLDGPEPGDEGALSFETAVGRTDGSRSSVSAQAVVTKVQHGVTREGVEQTISFVAVSSAGATDPVSVTALS